MRKLRTSLLAALLAVTAAVQPVFGAAADPTEITTSATTAFEAVTVLVVAVVGFYIIVRIVRGIKGR